MNIFTEYYVSSNQERQKEIQNTIISNLSFDFVDNYYLFVENDYNDNLRQFVSNLKDKNKVNVVEVNERCTYQFIIDFSNNETEEDTINLLVNNDIMFTDKVELVKNISHDEFYCLARWEKTVSDRIRIHGEFGGDSQDVWVWRGKCRIGDADFRMGVPGCDNVIAFKASASEYCTLNPSQDIVTIHNHSSEHRTYNRITDRLPRPYCFVRPHKLSANEELKKRQKEKAFT